MSDQRRDPRASLLARGDAKSVAIGRTRAQVACAEQRMARRPARHARPASEVVDQVEWLLRRQASALQDQERPRGTPNAPLNADRAAQSGGSPPTGDRGAPPPAQGAGSGWPPPGASGRALSDVRLGLLASSFPVHGNADTARLPRPGDPARASKRPAFTPDGSRSGISSS